MRILVTCLGILLFTALSVPQPLNATVGYVQGYVQAQIAGGSYLYGDYFHVKYCTGSNGYTGCSQTQANMYGFYSLNVPNWGYYWVFAWSDTYNWGSPTQSSASGTVFVSQSTYWPISRPRPTAPVQTYPQNNQGYLPVGQEFDITWTNETDYQRNWPGVWPIVWDLWASSWDTPVEPLFPDLDDPSLTIGATWLEPWTWYNTQPVARMYVYVGNPGAQDYRTVGTFTRWWTGGG